MRERIGKFLTVERQDVAGRTTTIWAVRGDEGDFLGDVRWWGAWRQYVFQPQPHTIFHGGCLEDITAFLKKQNVAARAECRARRGG
jgi:hypothetical protein